MPGRRRDAPEKHPGWKPAEEVEREAADVANYAMMIAEQARRGKRSGYNPNDPRRFGRQ